MNNHDQLQIDQIFTDDVEDPKSPNKKRDLQLA